LSTNAEILIKIGPVVAEIFGWYVDFRQIVQNSAVITLVISGVSGLILIKFAQNIAKSLPYNIFKSQLRYLNPFQNASVMNKGQFANFLKMVAMAKEPEKEVQINKIQARNAR